jgi:hypothetical protein
MLKDVSTKFLILYGENDQHVLMEEAESIEKEQTKIESFMR